MAERKANVGDWVCFRSAGKLVIGVVMYVRPPENYWEGPAVEGPAVYETDIGRVCDRDVIEVRRG